MQTPRRLVWNDRPERLQLVWTLHKGCKTARCELWSHEFGWELRLFAGNVLVQSQVVRSTEELVNTQDTWRAAMAEKVWTDAPGVT